MDRNYVIENQLVDRYLRDELSEEERAEFESYYLTDPEIFADLEVAQRLMDAVPERPAASRGGGIGDFLTSPQWAAAASVLLVCSLAFSGYLSLQRQAAPEWTSTQLVPLYATRSSDALQLARPAAGAWVVLLADPGPEPYDDYRVTITELESKRVIWQIGEVEAGYDGLLPVGVPGSSLAPGRFELEIEARKSDQSYVGAGSLTFEVR